VEKVGNECLQPVPAAPVTNATPGKRVGISAIQGQSDPVLVWTSILSDQLFPKLDFWDRVKRMTQATSLDTAHDYPTSTPLFTTSKAITKRRTSVRCGWWVWVLVLGRDTVPRMWPSVSERKYKDLVSCSCCLSFVMHFLSAEAPC
jgi:hypothetical protein